MIRMVAQVAVLRGVDSLYTYSIPAELIDAITPGIPVIVPFGNASAPGIVISLTPAPTQSMPLKPVTAIDASRPELTDAQLALTQWMQDHYLCSPFQAIQTVIGKQTVRAVPPTESTEIAQSVHTLSAHQSAIIESVTRASQYEECLIHGVTGSGKTEIYLHIVTALIRAGKSAIVLVPEIALTPQISALFSDRLGSHVAVVHSGLTPKQKSVVWNRIYHGDARVVIGPRSAVFSPLHNLGAIIVDECHDGSYKQDQTPRYDAIQVARFRARSSGIPLVLGSATPTIEQLYSAEMGNTTRFQLPHRILNRPMPTITILDTRDRDVFPDDALVGTPLISAIKIAIARGEKAMVLINRRGYAPTVSCQKCKNTVTCPECGLGYTYHSDRKLRCHRCFTITAFPIKCPSCSKGTIAISGIAIQKVELELRRHLPDSHILRLDRDTGSTAKKIAAIMSEFRDTGDVLIGTQMIAKGHDIADVTVVGIVGLDSALGIPDFRACERAFQLITQVSGRAGRGTLAGTVFIQTSSPRHYAVETAVHNELPRFINTELSYRKPLHYPPFTELCNIIFSGKNSHKVSEFGAAVFRILKTQLDPLCMTVMPLQPAPVPMIKAHYRWHILIKSLPGQMDLVRDTLRKMDSPDRGIRMIVDFDPQSIL